MSIIAVILINSRIKMVKFFMYIEYQASPTTNNENGLSIAFGNCGHVFHLDCVQRWHKTRSVCPLCNRSVTRLTHSIDVCITLILCHTCLFVFFCISCYVENGSSLKLKKFLATVP